MTPKDSARMSHSTPPADDSAPDDAAPSADPTMEAEFEERQTYIARLEQANSDLEQRIKDQQAREQASGNGAHPAPARSAPGTPSLAEIEDTLKRLVDRVCRFLQAEKCVFLLHDPVADTLYATHPAVGFAPDDLNRMERRVGDQGVSSEVFRTGKPVLTRHAGEDALAAAEGWPDFGVHTGASVPLIIEKRDDENRVIERSTVGVLHVFNKVYGQEFTPEDILLLQRMALTAAVIASAQMYREVIHEEQGLLHTIDSLYAGLLMIGTNRRLVQINPSARAILGIAPNVPLVGVPYVRAIPHAHVRSLLERVLAAPGTEVADEISMPVRDAAPDEEVKERIYQVQIATVRDDKGEPDGVFAIFNDITDIRGVERMKTAFVSTVSHELRTPLTGIKGFISTLLSDTEGYYDENTRHEFYGIINTECDRLTRLIDDLLDISRIEQGRAMQMHFETVDVPALVARVLSAQRALARDHTLSADFPPDFPPIEADPDKLDQILTNLVNNAIKYSPRGGAICVAGRTLGDSHHPPSISLRVSDEGMGIARDHLPKIWDRFYRVDNRDNREIGGTGIGLALVKALTEGHGGQVAPVESEVGRGTSFTIILPVAQEERTA